eukprot:CAMPEP_0171821894 /NCGR_PEP_ID=MMETSP0992-20121227/3568_1 /TAXON_ID=483369 /ORGANISM="non described non described, Strain CCMP2098" /LENGTH=91 /DNA_ID=CAMNT_0012436431 /DNA_START=98 /DNA_END=373 /DNA_ORIENTATION=-
MTCPVIEAAPSLARKHAAAPTSVPMAVRRKGALASAAAFSSVKPLMPRAARVEMGPGESALTRILRGGGPSSRASPRTAASSDAFAQPIAT